MKQRRIIAVLHNLAAPGGIAARVVVRGISVGGVVVAGAAGSGREIEAAAVRSGPAGVAVAGLRDAEAVEAAVWVCGAWCGGGGGEEVCEGGEEVVETHGSGWNYGAIATPRLYISTPADGDLVQAVCGNQSAAHSFGVIASSTLPSRSGCIYPATITVLEHPAQRPGL